MLFGFVNKTTCLGTASVRQKFLECETRRVCVVLYELTLFVVVLFVVCFSSPRGHLACKGFQVNQVNLGNG